MNLRVRQQPDIIRAADVETPWLAPLMRSEIACITQACCCPAPAVYAVVIAPQPSLPEPPEILLCAHHMRVARERLSRPDVAVYDSTGRFVEIAERLSI